MPLISALILGGTPLRYKLQVILTDTGVPTAIEINSAHVHDVHFLEQLKLLQLSNCQIIADKGYLSLKHGQELLTTRNISLITPVRVNMKKESSLWSSTYQRIRKKIETFFSQLRRRTAG
ncbi:transposase [Siphonobacter sp. SORGH_AS_1065]|uniref:transposase n=1 Tax=Siphonobacter sp. SORGH_AS_1065 TaxID=3041795 RepID=UPI00358F252C